jgi:hypothetical protein
MKYTKSKPCSDCPFLTNTEHAFTEERLEQFASGEFPCHKTATLCEEEESSQFVANDTSVHCAGALIYLEKRNRPHQMMRIAGRLGLYDMTALDLNLPVR